jgi:two-component sensor histidine kinase
MGVLYKKLDMLDVSMKYIMESITIAEKLNDENLMATSYNAIAGIQNKLGNYSDAISYYSKAETIFVNQNNYKGLANVYNNIGNVFSNLDSLELAKEYFLKSLKLKQKYGNIASLVSAHKNLGKLFLKLNIVDSSEFHFKKALNLSLEINHQSKTFSNLTALANLYLNEKEFDSTCFYLNRAKNIFNEALSNYLQLEYFEISMRYYQEVGLYRNAFAFAELYSEKKDEIFNIEKTKDLNDLRFQYETKKKEETIQYLNEIDQIKSKSIVAKNRFIVIILVGFFFILILAVFYIISYRNKRKAYAYIQLLMKETRHRTKNNLQLLSSILNLQVDQVNTEHKDAVMAAEYRVQSIVTLNNHLDINGRKDRIHLFDYINSLTKGLVNAYIEGDAVKLELNSSDFTIPEYQATHVGLIVNELITNSLKYTAPIIADPIITINCNKLDTNDCLLVIKDNGNGLDSGWENKLKDSFGLGLVIDLCHQLYAEYLIENRNGFYFEAQFKIQ